MPGTLHRELGLRQAVLLGLGSILGTGVFVSLGLAAGLAGPAVVVAVAAAGLLAFSNATSSAQLAAALPVSGGTYEYGHAFLTPTLGFTAGWTFLLAKSASAATAALGLAGYLLHAVGASGSVPLVWIAVPAALLLTALVAGGVRRSSAVNTAIVTLTLGCLALFVVAGAPTAASEAGRHLEPFVPPGTGAGALLEATALLFVAYTGYGRIATLGEEVRAPRRTIPRAILVTLGVTALLYMAVAVVAVGSIGPDALGRATTGEAAPLEVAARSFRVPAVAPVIAVGAVAAMAGVLLNLLLGLSRVLLAMARRGDMPRRLARLSPDADRATTTPAAAVWTIGLVITGLAALGDVKLAWSASAFTVLIYYALTNLAALRLPPEDRLYPRALAWGGLAGCLFLAFWVEPAVWAGGLGLLAVGLVWHRIARARA